MLVVITFTLAFADRTGIASVERNYSQQAGYISESEAIADMIALSNATPEDVAQIVINFG